MVDSISRIALKGIQTGMEKAAKSAERLTSAAAPNGSGDIAGPIVDLKQAEVQVKASEKVAKTGQELDDAILDILA